MLLLTWLAFNRMPLICLVFHLILRPPTRLEAILEENSPNLKIRWRPSWGGQMWWEAISKTIWSSIWIWIIFKRLKNKKIQLFNIFWRRSPYRGISRRASRRNFSGRAVRGSDRGIRYLRSNFWVLKRHFKRFDQISAKDFRRALSENPLNVSAI